MATITASADTFGISNLGRRVQCAVSCRKEAVARQLESFVLELLAAIVLIAIFLVMSDPAAHEDPEVDQSGAQSSY